MSTVEQHTTHTYTPADLLRLPDGDRFELVNGQLVEKRMGGKSSWVGGEIFGELRNYARRHGGWAFPSDASFQCFPFEPGMVRRPDAAYVAAGRFENDEIPDGHIAIPPDLAVEVVSPHDVYTRVEDKVGEYLQAGVRVVWILNPENRSVRVFEESANRSVQFGPDDELSAEDVLPGFRCRIADLFVAAGKDASKP